MDKEMIDRVGFEGTQRMLSYIIDADFKVTVPEDIEPKDFLTRKNGMIYAGFDGPFSAKGFFVIDSEQKQLNDEQLLVRYIVSAKVTDEQFDKYAEAIINPIIAKFWVDSAEALKEADTSVKKVAEKLHNINT